MPKARAIVPTTNPSTGEPIAAGAEVELDEEAYNALRQQGAVEASEEEQKASQTPEAQGNYSERMTRGQAGEAESTQPPPAEPPKPEEPPKKK